MLRECSPCVCENCGDEHCLEKVLSQDSNYEVVVHNNHLDVVMNGTLHHLHNGHFDNHGIYDASATQPTKMYVKNLRNLLYVGYMSGLMFVVR